MTEKEIIDVINELDFDFKFDPINTSPDTTLTLLGVDSLDLFDILQALEAKTGKQVPDSDIEKLSTIKELAAYFS
ncbi:MAG: acyl carrier protein [Gallionellaceae bacterium]